MQTLREAWEEQAGAWAAWARTPGHDHFFWRFNLPRFLELVPDPGRLTVEVGCGEGRVLRALSARGHRVVGVDASPTLAWLAATHADGQPVALGDAAALPVREASADLVVAFMSLQDVDDLEASVREIGRILRPGGHFCMAVLHPLSTAGDFAGDDVDSRFVLGHPYGKPARLVQHFERNGLTMVFHSMHRPLAAYVAALGDARLAIDALTEPEPDEEHVRDEPRMARVCRVPLYLHVRAVRV